MSKKENLKIGIKFIFLSIVALSSIERNNSLLLNFSVITMILIFFRYFKTLFDISNLKEKMLKMQSFYMALIFSIIIYFLFDFIFIFRLKKDLFFSLFVGAFFVMILSFVYNYYMGKQIYLKINPEKENEFLGKSLEIFFSKVSNWGILIAIFESVFNLKSFQSLENIIKMAFCVVGLILPLISMTNLVLSDFKKFEFDQKIKRKNQFKYDLYNY